MNTSKTAPMPDLFSFLVYGFRNFLKPKAVWFFSLFQFLVITFFDIVKSIQTQRLLSEFYSFVSDILIIICIIGIYYIAYNYFLEKTLSIRQIFRGIRKYLWVGIACQIINGMLLLPVVLIFFIIQYVLHSQSITTSIPQKFLVLIFFAFSAFLCFPIFELFDKNLSSGKSISNGNRVFGNNFYVLALLGIIAGFMQLLWGFLSKILTSFLETIINIPTTSNIGIYFYNPSVDPNPFFILVNRFGTILSVPFYAFIFISAYFKYHTPLVPEPVSGEPNSHE